MIVDRIEGGFAVCETDEGMVDVPLSQLPEDVREGDVIAENEYGYVVDRELTEEKRESNASLLRSLLGGGND